jgi:hypothetical protein
VWCDKHHATKLAARVVFCLTHSAQEGESGRNVGHWGAPLAVACVAGTAPVASTRPQWIRRLHLAYCGLLDGQTCTREALTFPACSALSSLCSLIMILLHHRGVVLSSPSQRHLHAGSYRCTGSVKYRARLRASESSLPLTHKRLLHHLEWLRVHWPGTRCLLYSMQLAAINSRPEQEDFS